MSGDDGNTSEISKLSFFHLDIIKKENFPLECMRNLMLGSRNKASSDTEKRLREAHLNYEEMFRIQR